MNLSVVKAGSPSVFTNIEQQRFAELVDNATKISDRILEIQTLIDKHRITYLQVVNPLRHRQESLKKTIIVMLDDRFELGGLSSRQKRLIGRAICRLSRPYALQGDAAMLNLHDKHSEQTLAEIEKIQAEAAQAHFEKILGESFDSDEHFERVDDVLSASIERMHKQRIAKEKAKEKRRRRESEAKQSSSVESNDSDAQHILRSIYRQLASALHPDRERDKEKRIQKTDLMSQVNTAYSNGDLFTLLQLQNKADIDKQLVTESLSSKLATVIAILERRVVELRRKLRDLEIDTVAEFVLPSAVSITAPLLKAHLTKLQLDLRSTIATLKNDITELETDTGINQWLRRQEV